MRLKNSKNENKYLKYLLNDKINRQKKLVNKITILSREIEYYKEKNRLLEQELEAYKNIEKKMYSKNIVPII